MGTHTRIPDKRERQQAKNLKRNINKYSKETKKRPATRTKNRTLEEKNTGERRMTQKMPK